MTIEGVTTTITLDSGTEIDVEWSVEDAVASITHIESTRKMDADGFNPQSQMLAVVLAEQRVLELPGIDRVESLAECYERAAEDVPEV